MGSGPVGGTWAGRGQIGAVNVRWALSGTQRHSDGAPMALRWPSVACVAVRWPSGQHVGGAYLRTPFHPPKTSSFSADAADEEPPALAVCTCE